MQPLKRNLLSVALASATLMLANGAYAQSAAKALLDHTALSAEQIVRESLKVAGELCIYTNMNHTVEVLA